MNLKEWKIQIKRGTLEFCILLLLRYKTCYGYEIIQELSKYHIVDTSENAVYPLLSRLTKKGILLATWKEISIGERPRKYYTLTPTGEQYLNSITKEWDTLLIEISKLRELK